MFRVTATVVVVTTLAAIALVTMAVWRRAKRGIGMSYPLATLPPNAGLDPKINALMRADYVTRRRFIWRKIHERPTRFLYKFRALIPLKCEAKSPGSFTDRSVQNLRDIVVRSLLRLGCAADFNDPFDMAVHGIVQGTDSQRRERFSAMIEANRVPGQDPEAALHRLMEASEEELLRVFRTSLQRQRHITGVYCFGGDPNSTLMWSHYAEQHTGVCLQFERAKDFITLSRALTVDYDSTYPVVNWLVDFQAGIEVEIPRGVFGSWKDDQRNQAAGLNETPHRSFMRVPVG